MYTSGLESLSPSQRKSAFIKRLRSYVSPKVLNKIIQCIAKINKTLTLTKKRKNLFELSMADLLSFIRELELTPTLMFDPSLLSLIQDILKLYEYYYLLVWFANEKEILFIISRISENDFVCETKNETPKLLFSEAKASPKPHKSSLKKNNVGKYYSYYKRNRVTNNSSTLIERLGKLQVTPSIEKKPNSKSYEEVCSEIIHKVPSLREYIEQISLLPPARPGEIKQLIIRLHQNDEQAKERLVEIYIKKALSCALKASNKIDADLEDTISNALLSLWEYFRSFNGKKEDLQWLQLKLERDIERKAIPRWMSFIPETYKEKLDLIEVHEFFTNRDLQFEQLSTLLYDEKAELPSRLTRFDQVSETIDKYQKTIFERLDSYAPLEKLASYLHINKYELQKYYDLTNSDEYDEQLLDYKDKVNIFHYLLSVEYIDEKTYDTTSIQHAYSQLMPNEKLVIASRMGFGGIAPMTLAEIGIMMGISGARIHQIEIRAINKIKNLISTRSQIFTDSPDIDEAAYNTIKLFKEQRSEKLNKMISEGIAQ